MSVVFDRIRIPIEFKSWAQLIDQQRQYHRRKTFVGKGPLMFPWEGMERSGLRQTVFDQIDAVHSALDAMALDPIHSKNLLLNLIHLQLSDGFIPARVMFRGEKASLDTEEISMPIWSLALDEYASHYQDEELLEQGYRALKAQVEWFEKECMSRDGGFFYNFNGKKETNDLGASSHVYACYCMLLDWSKNFGESLVDIEVQAEQLKDYIQLKFDQIKLEKRGFKELWKVHWPVSMGALSLPQALRYINLIEQNLKESLSHTEANESFYDQIENGSVYWFIKGLVQYQQYESAKWILKESIDLMADSYEEIDSNKKLRCESMTRIYKSSPAPLIAMAEMYEMI